MAEDQGYKVNLEPDKEENKIKYYLQEGNKLRTFDAYGGEGQTVAITPENQQSVENFKKTALPYNEAINIQEPAGSLAKPMYGMPMPTQQDVENKWDTQHGFTPIAPEEKQGKNDAFSLINEFNAGRQVQQDQEQQQVGMPDFATMQQRNLRAGQSMQNAAQQEYGVAQKKAADYQKLVGDYATAFEGIQAQKAEKEAVIEKERTDAIKKSQALWQDVQNTEIDPKRLFRNMNAWNRVIAGLSVMAGAVGSALLEQGGNTALDIIMGAVENDIDAQKSEYEKKKSGFTMQQTIYEQQKEGWADERQKWLNRENQLLNAVKLQGDINAAKYGSEDAKINWEKTKAAIDEKMNANDINIGNLQAVWAAKTGKGGDKAKAFENTYNAVLINLKELDTGKKFNPKTGKFDGAELSMTDRVTRNSAVKMQIGQLYGVKTLRGKIAEIVDDMTPSYVFKGSVPIGSPKNAKKVKALLDTLPAQKEQLWGNFANMSEGFGAEDLIGE